jgi:hypothetical protein
MILCVEMYFMRICVIKIEGLLTPGIAAMALAFDSVNPNDATM